MQKNIIKRFQSKIKKTKNCWLFLGHKDKDGYGRFSVGHDLTVGAHRFSYELFKGPIPKDIFVCHSCDNPSCINPKHLWLGTCKDNLLDRDKKGRGLTGERNGRAKLNWGKIKKIRKLYKTGNYSSIELSKKYKVSKPAILDIIHCRHWIIK